MPIEFLCPKCKTLLATADGTSGQSVKCTSCGLVMAVPDLTERPASADAILSEVEQEYNVLDDDDTRAFQLVGLEPDRPPSAVWQQESTPHPQASETQGGGEAERPTPAEWDASASVSAILDEFPLSEPDRLFSPAPQRFDPLLALAYGWHILRRNLLAFVVPNLLIVGVLVAAAWLMWWSRSWTLWLVVPPVTLLLVWAIALALAAITIRAARGLPLGWPLLRGLIQHGSQVVPTVGVWLVLMLVLHVGWATLVVASTQVLGLLVGLAVSLLMTLLTLVALAHVIWLPLVACDDPAGGLGQHLGRSMRMGRSELGSIVLLLASLGCAIVGLLPLVVLFGLPLAASGVAAAYVLLCREFNDAG